MYNELSVLSACMSLLIIVITALSFSSPTIPSINRSRG